ncbi:Hsp20/alpha crystallin family protein [Propionibacterium freudenreichii]|jgi:HSP20 family protein|uniref:Hsp20/alpha crystallin family protein n=1 Tax=Propionibacterium freudenreichii TaxID=1744 RepID=UPI00054397E4|nr:Hsp20/alpha crystallin family protein [Propionibacterium freudenreichii]MCT3013110.1 Hsp20/alpha crystallin family protein [Propionibacterium freudenreichii]MDK9611052.1 Hsp20/alpha crystallin family protein [Propionibacterium freudenreichii]MDK9620443.1 Hsp20/alpha crystallin family protein [Propionibacterium freudenreichii]MDK9623383.1 Hsp20/alpha crystallin family protein [Propionibacterium freudenreichii]MDK9676315.1 Hsp20/alpha crystallin family protein [Propionibacterium freudenreichi
MSTAIYNPFREMDRFFNQVAKTVGPDTRYMPLDLYRDGDQFVAKMDLPGVDPATIDIDVDDRTLSVRAERKAEQVHKDDKSHWVSRERSYGTYARQLTLGPGLDLSRINADYSDGVLTLTIPVAEDAKPRKIEVTTSASQPSVESGEQDK